MNAGLYRGASAMVAEERRLDVVAANLANLGTVGYKRRGSASHAFEVPARVPGTTALGARSGVDWSQGELERTGRALDLALFGEGLLAVEAPDGEAYTRDGHLQLDSHGVLQTVDGYPLVWEGPAGTVDPAGLPIVVDGDGGVRQGDRDLGRLRIVAFEDPSRLELDGTGLWRAPADLGETAHRAVVHQGALERANVDGITEMVALIEVQRAFEHASRVISSIDRSYQRLTRNG